MYEHLLCKLSGHACLTLFSSVCRENNPRTIPGTKDQRVSCSACTFLNSPDTTVCAMCENEMKPLTHDIQVNGTWLCGVCTKENTKGSKECRACKTPFYSIVTSAAPLQIFCSRCGFLNDGNQVKCTQCDHTIRTTIDKWSTDLRDSTNFLARDMGVSVNVKCPGCLIICCVPPATACLRCGSCQTYFASPSVGEVTNFHMSRLASSLSSSFMGFFRSGNSSGNESTTSDDAPLGKLIAPGQRHPSIDSLHCSDSSNLSTSRIQEDVEEEKKKDPVNTDEETKEREGSEENVKQEEEEKMDICELKSAYEPPPMSLSPPMAPPSAPLLSPSSKLPVAYCQSSKLDPPYLPHASIVAVPVLPPFPLSPSSFSSTHEIIRVEGEVIEL